MSPEVHPLLDLHARCHHKRGGSGDIQETEKGNFLLKHILTKQPDSTTSYLNRILKIYNRICWRHLCWRPPPCNGSHRQLGPEGLPLLSSRSSTMMVLPRVTMISITFLGGRVSFPQTMWIWFWLLMWTVNNFLVTMVSLCEIGPRCNHDVPQLRVLEGILLLKDLEAKRDNPPVEEGGHLQGWYRPGPTDRAGRLRDTLQPGEDREEAWSKSISLF